MRIFINDSDGWFVFKKVADHIEKTVQKFIKDREEKALKHSHDLVEREVRPEINIFEQIKIESILKKYRG